MADTNNERKVIMKLYYSSGACSLASHIALKEAGLNFTVEKVDLKTHKFGDKDFYKVSPMGYVPALELDNGQILTEGAAILQYIADQKPESDLIPKAGTFERYKAQEMLNFISTEIYKGMEPLWSDETPVAVKATARERLATRFEFLNKQLSDKQFLLGSKFTVCDAYLLTMLRWCPDLKVDLTKFPKLMAFVEITTQRPGVQAAFKAEGISNK